MGGLYPNYLLETNMTDETAVKLPRKNLKTSVFLMVVSEHPLVEPFTHQRFDPGVSTETSEITPWLQMQIIAGLIKEVK
jgi:hypothetical protein